MDGHPQLERAGAYALGALDAEERAEFEAHLAAGCDACRAEIAVEQALVAALPCALPAEPPAAVTREQLLDLADAPRELPDLEALTWEEVAPGVRLHVLKEDPSRGMRACLAWAKPGATTGRHVHKGGDELILVLRGGLRDDRGEYHEGDLCRSREGSVHTEEILPGEDCVAYLLYYCEQEAVDR
jgi:anti-sigma factor ChrR (cupin superfamily)